MTQHSLISRTISVVRCAAVQSPAPTLMTTPDSTRYPTPMAPIATVVASIATVVAVAWISPVIPVARIVAVAVSITGIPISVSVVSITPRADVDVNLFASSLFPPCDA